MVVYKNLRNGIFFPRQVCRRLCAIDYNAAGCERADEKLTMLTRLLPFVEKRADKSFR